MDNYYDNNNFDLEKFNKGFENIQSEKKKKERLAQDEYLNSLKKVEVSKKITDLNISEILTNTKNEVLDLTYDLISFDYDSFDDFINLFTKNNRLFYIGLFMLLISCILYIISYIFFYPSDITKNDININIPNDYSFNYKPYEIQTNEQSEQIKKLNEQIETLKNPVVAPPLPPPVVASQAKSSNNLAAL